MKPTEEAEGARLVSVTVNLTTDDVAWIDRKKKQTVESRSTVLRSVLREAREREQASASS